MVFEFKWRPRRRVYPQTFEVKPATSISLIVCALEQYPMSRGLHFGGCLWSVLYQIPSGSIKFHQVRFLMEPFRLLNDLA